MSTVKEIEEAIEQLSTKEKWDLHNWLAEQMADEWDRQIEADAKAGKLDKLWAKAKADIAAGRVKPLDEFLDHK
ncbi:MAG: hypothetical protein FJ398_11285 [Verrucomicrobia bacterium]|nr:hypothetical protein [Verrucomicrobiota bacterium]